MFLKLTGSFGFLDLHTAMIHTKYMAPLCIAVGESQQAIGHAPRQVDVQLDGNHEKTAGQRRQQRQGVIGKSYFLKFIYSEKATKFCEIISTFILTGTT